jgi:predicted site-specific integrase-resolvase
VSADPVARQPKPLMRVPEVADLFEVDPETVRVWARTGKLRSRKNPGGRVLVFLRTDVEALLQGDDQPPPVQTEAVIGQGVINQ